MSENEEHLLYRWYVEGHEPMYFTVPIKLWEKHDRDGNDRTILARGTEDEMNRFLKLFKERA
jgi:hypothetical protein